MVGIAIVEKAQSHHRKDQIQILGQDPKFGICIPKSVEEARQLDLENGDTLWWDAICREMKNVRIAFEEFEGGESAIPIGYQKINCHIIFDI